MDFNIQQQPNSTLHTNTTPDLIYTNFVHSASSPGTSVELYNGLYMVPFCKLTEGIIAEILTDGDFEEEDDLGDIELGYLHGNWISSCPNFLDDSQILAMKEICSVQFYHSVLLDVTFPVYSFLNTNIELALLDTPLRDRSFYLHSGLNVWCRMMESFLNNGPLVIDPEDFDYERDYLRRRITDPLFSFAFSFLFYGTVIMEWVITGRVTLGLRGGVDEEREVDPNPPEPKKISKKLPPALEQNADPPSPAKKKKPRWRKKKVKEADPKETKQESPAPKQPPPGCKICKGNHRVEDCPDKACFHCKSKDHLANTCPSKPNKTTRKTRGTVRRGGKKANLIQENLIQNLQQAQGEADAFREQAVYIAEQRVEAILDQLAGSLNNVDDTVQTFKRKPVGIKFRTESAIVVEVSKVDFQPTLFGNCVSKVFSFLTS